MPSSCNPTTGSFHSIDIVTCTRQRETAISRTLRTIVAPRACSISSTPSVAIPLRDSPTANLSLYTCCRSSTSEKQWV